jgi:hypothetical protein
LAARLKGEAERCREALSGPVGRLIWEEGLCFGPFVTSADNFNELSAVPFTSASGTVTIASNGAVPEPASIISGLTAILILAFCQVGRGFTRRKSRPI